MELRGGSVKNRIKNKKVLLDKMVVDRMKNWWGLELIIQGGIIQGGILQGGIIQGGIIQGGIIRGGIIQGGIIQGGIIQLVV